MSGAKVFFCGCLTGIVSLLGGYDIALRILLVFIALDYFTGLIKGFKNHNLSSEVGFIGLLRKVCILIVVIVAYQADLFFGLAHPYLRTFAVAIYAINESISILENIANLGVYVPPQIINFLKAKESEVESNGP